MRKVAADNHRLGFGVVDVGRNDGATARDLVAHEFGGDLGWDRRAKGIAVAPKRAAKIFANGNEFHFLGDEALACVVKLGDVAAGFGAQGLACGSVELWDGEAFAVLEAVVLRFAGAAFIFFHIAAGENPIATLGSKAFGDIDTNGFVRIRTGCVIEPYGRFAAGQRHFTKRHAVHQQLARADQGTASDHLVGHSFRIENRFVHSPLPTPVLTGSGSKGPA